MTMLEKLARAICEVDRERVGMSPMLPGDVPEGIGRYRDYVRAILTVLEQPDEGMIEAGEAVPMISLGNGEYRDAPPADTFTAMIQSIATEKTDG